MDTKPKLVFFQYRYDQSLPKFLLLQKEEHVKCLAEFFNVTVINHDCDYQEVCDTVLPDLTLVESGVSYSSCTKLKVTNTRAYPDIPKIGLMNSDAFCFTRQGFVSDMAHWGIDTAFAIATTAPEHTPHIVKNLFVWPVFVDLDVYRDYGLWKSIPILFTGNTNSLYPWRQRITSLVSKHYPSLVCPHPGYAPRVKSGRAPIQFMVGETYAKTLNASQLVFACGTVAKDVVRKHFEIPAAKACLVTERSAALEAAGFVDMKNCVFADHRNILEKLDYLFTHQDELAEITEAGHQLVRSHHTLKHRDQIRQWYDLRKTLTDGKVIAQPDPFQPLQIIERCAAASLPKLLSNGDHLKLLREGDKRLTVGEYDEAERLYNRCWNFIPWMPEPKLRLAICQLYKGDAQRAMHWISQPLHSTLAKYEADEPDPVEWAYFVIILLCQGHSREAAKHAAQFSSLHHEELDRLRSAIAIIRGNGDEFGGALLLEQRVSIHVLPSRDLTEWKRHLCLMLNACGQAATADTVSRWEPRQSGLSSQRQMLSRAETAKLSSTAITSVGNSPRFRLNRHLDGRQSLRRSLKRKYVRTTEFMMYQLERWFGYFLPYRMSSARQDEFYQCLERIAEQEDVRSIFIVGANNDKYTVKALHTGANQNKNEVAMFFLATEKANEAGSGFEIKKFKQEKDVDFFDLAVIDLSASSGLYKHAIDASPHCLDAKFIAIEGMSEISKYPEYHELTRNSRYVPLASDPALRNGYVVFERREWLSLEANISEVEAAYSATQIAGAGQ